MLSPENPAKGISLGDIGQVPEGRASVVTGLKGKKIIQGDIYKLKKLNSGR